MILISVGMNSDLAVTDTVGMIKRATNRIYRELHDCTRLEIEQIEGFIQESSDNRIVIVSHGSSRSLLDASIRKRDFLTMENVKVLSDCYVFVHSCLTGAFLGKEIMKHANIFIGFDAPISAPPDCSSICFQDVLELYQAILSYLDDIVLVDLHNEIVAASKILDAIEERVGLIEQQFDTDEGSLLSAEELIVLMQFRNDICIWLRGSGSVIKRRNAPTRPLLW